ncbi:Highly reducing polyketide synthase ctvA [Bienertia sinuspersici]
MDLGSQLTTMQAEALALFKGLTWARNQGFQDMLVYTDSSQLIYGLQRRSTTIDFSWVIKTSSK